jgi:hypothetical protein
MAKRFRITSNGSVFDTVVTDLETGATIPVASITFDVNVTDHQQAAVKLTIPGSLCELDLVADAVRFVLPMPTQKPRVAASPPPPTP